MSLEITEHNPPVWTEGGTLAANVQPWPRTPIPAKVQKLLRGYLTVPTFSVNSPAGGFPASFNVIQFNYQASSPFAFAEDAFTFFSTTDFGTLPGFMICVKWFNIGDTEAHRYILAELTNSTFELAGLNYFDQYAGQLIPKNFSIEIWSQILHQGLPPFNKIINTTAIQAFMSLLFNPANASDMSSRIGANQISSIAYNTAGAGFPTNSFPIPFTLNPLFTFIGN